MGVGFSDAHGSAQKTGLEYIKLELGVNEFRMVGELRPRYAYWKKLKTNSIPVECLSFDPVQEKFTNLEKDWFKEYFPDSKCVWSYVVQVIDKNNELKLCGLKKKLFDQIKTAMRSLGDPTDFEEGWPVVLEKNKTGNHKFNVEYILDVLACQDGKGPLTTEQLEAAEGIKPIDELIPRMTADEQKAFINSAWLSGGGEEEVDPEVIDELAAAKKDERDAEVKKFEEDIPF